MVPHSLSFEGYGFALVGFSVSKKKKKKEEEILDI